MGLPQEGRLILNATTVELAVTVRAVESPMSEDMVPDWQNQSGCAPILAFKEGHETQQRPSLLSPGRRETGYNGRTAWNFFFFLLRCGQAKCFMAILKSSENNVKSVYNTSFTLTGEGN